MKKNVVIYMEEFEREKDPHVVCLWSVCETSLMCAKSASAPLEWDSYVQKCKICHSCNQEATDLVVTLVTSKKS